METKKKLVTGMILTLIILSMLIFAFNVQPIKAGRTVYIRADGSVDPPTAPITSANNVTYTFTDNINDSVVIQRSNIIVNGNGYTLQGSGSANGFYLSDVNKVIVQNTHIQNFSCGVHLSPYCKYNTVSGNTIIDSYSDGVHLSPSCEHNTVSGNTIVGSYSDGVHLSPSCKYNTVSGNTIVDSYSDGVRLSPSCEENIVSGNTITGSYSDGVHLSPSCKHNTISENTLAENKYGVYLYSSSNNKIYHNNFINNTNQAGLSDSEVNIWDDGYPSGGNYWSDYNGTDLYNGPYQNQTGSDGIGDTPYVIDENNQDNYPLMEPWSPPPRSTRYSWPMFHHNLRHTGYTESPAPNTNQTLWNYPTGEAVYSSPAVADGMVFMGSNDGNVYALDECTGEHVWDYTTGYAVVSSPAVADGMVYVGCSDSNVYALNETTGELIWNYTTGGSICSSPAVVDGVVFAGSEDTNLYALNAITGASIWNYTTGGAVDSSPAVADGMVFVGSHDGYVYALNQSTGALMWSYLTGDYVISSPAIADGKVYVGSHDDKVYCLDASTGASIWNYTTGGAVDSSPAVADGMVFVGSSDRVYAFGNIIRVPQDYPTIKEATDAAPPEATIIIAPGIYYESIATNKTLTIIGLPGSAPIFSGGGSGIAITLLPGASGSTIAGVVITQWDEGILILDSSDCKIYDNIMSLMNDNGITLEGDNAANNLIYYNVFEDNTIAVNLTASSTSNTIYKNIISSNDVGLNVESNGNIIYANTIAENQVGIDVSNSAGSIIYHNSFVDNTVQVSVSTSAENVWNDGYPSGGNYWSTHTSPDLYNGPDQNEPGSDGIVDIQYTIAVNNTDRYPLVQPLSPHDIGITSVIAPKTVVGQSFTLPMDLRILNYGMCDETFTVTAYANTIIIATQTITLASRNSITLILTWNTAGFAKGNYTISAIATQVPGETDTTDNNMTDGWVIVAMVGDITGMTPDVPDGVVDIFDIVYLATSYGAIKNEPNYKPNADINSDGVIDIFDLVTIAVNYGQTDP